MCQKFAVLRARRENTFVRFYENLKHFKCAEERCKIVSTDYICNICNMTRSVATHPTSITETLDSAQELARYQEFMSSPLS